MIADASVGTSFPALAAYLEYGPRDGSRRDRVDWIESRNLPTTHPQAAARIMRATARDSESIQPPVYHFSISFAPDDPVTREMMRNVADRTLRDLGLENYQVLIVAHRDTAHPHMHFMVNRVHPERLNVWNNWHDFKRIETILRALEVELGLRIVPGRHAPVPEQARHLVVRDAPAPRLVRGDDAFRDHVSRVAGPHLLGARSWAELESALAEHGLAVRPDGRGMVVTDGVQKIKCSEIDRAASRYHVERRLGALNNYRARQAVAGRTMEERAARAPQPQQPAAVPVLAPEPRTVPAPMMTPAPASRAPADPPPVPRRTSSYAQSAREFSGAIRAVYAHPAAARRAFIDAAERRGPERAAALLRAEPWRFGALRPGADRARAARAAVAGYHYARSRGERLRPALVRAARHLRDAARMGPHHASGDLREAAAVLASAQIGRHVTADHLARRLAPMLPRSAAGLAGQALRIGREMLREQEREHQHQHERRGISL